MSISCAKKETGKRSPLKAPPLHNAGQSLDEEIHKIISEDVGTYAAIVALSIMLTFCEWWKWWWDKPPQPVIITLVSLAFSGYALIKIFSLKKKVRQLRQARDGEKAVGQYLETLRERGYRVFHDVVGEKFNLDHVLVGPAGVFTIETKTISKPKRGNSEIAYDGETITVDGFRPDRDPVTQAKAQAKWLQQLINETAGKRLKVRPVVLYAGWFVAKQPKGAEVWVLNPKNLPGFLEHEDATLKNEEVHLVAYHLSRYARVAGTQ